MVSARALMLLCLSSSFRCRRPRLAKMGEDLPCDVALEAADDFRLRLSFCGATADIVDSGLVGIHPVTTARTISPTVVMAHRGCRTGSVSMAFNASVSDRPR